MDHLPVERRITSRVRADTIGPLVLRSESDVSLPAQALDFSVTGIGLVTDSHVEAGTVWAIEPARAGRKFSGTLTVEVRHARGLTGPHWRLSCKFLRMLTVDDVQSFG
jgi:hypothetical protein